MNNFTRNYFPTITPKTMVTIHVSILLLMLLEIFARGVNIESVLLFGFVAGMVNLVGGLKFIMNNYIVHLLTVGFTPLLIAVHAKYGIFAETSFWGEL